MTESEINNKVVELVDELERNNKLIINPYGTLIQKHGYIILQTPVTVVSGGKSLKPEEVISYLKKFITEDYKNNINGKKGNSNTMSDLRKMMSKSN